MGLTQTSLGQKCVTCKSYGKRLCCPNWSKGNDEDQCTSPHIIKVYKGKKCCGMGCHDKQRNPQPLEMIETQVEYMFSDDDDHKPLWCDTIRDWIMGKPWNWAPVTEYYNKLSEE